MQIMMQEIKLSITQKKLLKFNFVIFLDSTKLKIVWIKITAFFKRHISIIP